MTKSNNNMHQPPTKIELHQKSRILALHFEPEGLMELPCEYLRVFSPSAEVKGHGPGQETLQTGKRNVSITDIKPVGNYALKLIFSDSHDTGLYSWAYLLELGINFEKNWEGYLKRLHDANATRDPDVSVVKFSS